MCDATAIWKNRRGILVMEWLTLSPDLNSMKNPWSIKKLKVNAENPEQNL